MRKGLWHQCGHNSQRLVIEQIQKDVGVGVILSSRDIAQHRATEYSRVYRQLGCDLVIDMQFCKPDFTNSKLQTYETQNYRQTISKLNNLDDDDVVKFTKALEKINKNLNTTAILAPAVKYEASRPDILRLNKKLFNASKEVGDKLSLPTYATIILGDSITKSVDIIDKVLSDITCIDCDGWYYGFEFDTFERIPAEGKEVYNCCVAGLKLACTGKPVLHAFAGPLGLLSSGFGATGIGIGHWQNLWQFTRGRFEEKDDGGGGGDAPPRFFSQRLWGTIVYPDEIRHLPSDLRDLIYTKSPFAPPNFQRIIPWGKWDSYKHLLYVIGDTINQITKCKTAKKSLLFAREVLEEAIKTHKKIRIELKDNTFAYQNAWLKVIDDLIKNVDYEYLEML